MNTIRPNQDYIFAKPTKAETKTASGILLDKPVEHPQTALVINTGKDVKDIKPNDLILYKKYGTNEIKLNGDDYILVKQEDVLGVVIETA